MSLDFTFSDEELDAVQGEANPYLADPAKGMELITRLIAQPKAAACSGERQHFKHLHDLIHQSYVSLSALDTCPTEALNYRDLITLEGALEDLAAFPDLANKTVIGIGGGFSAGKSRFINTLLNNDLLPEALEPTTAIPSYLIAGTHEVIRALNQFNHDVELDRPALQAITHAFPNHYRQNHGMEVGFAHMVRLLMIHDPNLPWQNLAFLDTPGYSKPDHPQSAQTDRQIALRQLKEADQVLWLINAKNGSIRQDDIEFLRDLDHPNPVFFVITQADLVGKSRISAIIQSTAETLDKAHIQRAGLMAWAAPIGCNQGQKWVGDDIYNWLTKLNGTTKETDTRVKCARILDSHILYNTRSLAENRELLRTLNELLPLTGATESRQQREHRKQASDLLENLKNTVTKLKMDVSAKTKNKSARNSIFGSIFTEQSLSESQNQNEPNPALARSLSNCLKSLAELGRLLNTTSNRCEDSQAAILSQHIADLRKEQHQLKVLIDNFGSLKDEMLKTITLLIGNVVNDREVRQGHQLFYTMKYEWFSRPLDQGEEFNVRVVAVKQKEKKVVVVLGDDLATTGLGFAKIRDGLRMDPLALVKGSLLHAEVHSITETSVTLIIRQLFA